MTRLAYDATVDDAVDVAWRLANRTHAFRKQIEQNVIFAGIAGGLVFFAAWMYFAGVTPFNLMPAVLGGALSGIMFALLFRRELIKQIHKQQRSIIAEQFGGKPTIQSEIELRPDAVWVRQAGMEMTFPWTLCTGIQGNPHDIEMNFSPGICVVRNRHFASVADREAFLDTARRLSTNLTNLTNPT